MTTKRRAKKKSGNDATPNVITPEDTMDVIVLTPQQRLQRYATEEAALCAKYGIVKLPFIKTYPNGRQVADLEIAADPNWAAGE